MRQLLLASPGPMRQTMADALSRLGAHPTEVDDLRSVYESLDADVYDLLIADEKLCDTEELRRFRERMPNTSVWLVTNDLEIPSKERLADFLLFNPVDMRVLRLAWERARAEVPARA